MEQLFIQKLDSAGYDKLKLLALMQGIDSDKTSAKLRLQQVSTNPEPELSSKDRDQIIRTLKFKIRCLTDNREIIRQRLGTIGFYKKAFNKALNSRKAGFSSAFLAAAELKLSPAAFEELEQLAGEILVCMQESTSNPDNTGNK